MTRICYVFHRYTFTFSMKYPSERLSIPCITYPETAHSPPQFTVNYSCMMLSRHELNPLPPENWAFCELPKKISFSSWFHSCYQCTTSVRSADLESSLFWKHFFFRRNLKPIAKNLSETTPPNSLPRNPRQELLGKLPHATPKTCRSPSSNPMHPPEDRPRTLLRITPEHAAGIHRNTLRRSPKHRVGIPKPHCGRARKHAKNPEKLCKEFSPPRDMLLRPTEVRCEGPPKHAAGTRHCGYPPRSCVYP